MHCYQKMSWIFGNFISVTHNTSIWLSEPFNQDSYLPTYLDKQIEDLDELNPIEQMMAYDLSTIYHGHIIKS